MNKKAVIGGLCAIIALGCFYFRHNSKKLNHNNTNYDNTIILPQPAVISVTEPKVDSLADFNKEFSKRVVATNETENYKNELIANPGGSTPYDQQKSDSQINNTLYLGDASGGSFSPNFKSEFRMSNLAPEKAVNEGVKP